MTFADLLLKYVPTANINKAAPKLVVGGIARYPVSSESFIEDCFFKNIPIFVLEPLDFPTGLTAVEFLKHLFQMGINDLKYVSGLPIAILLPKEPPSFSFEASNNLTNSIFEDIANIAEKIGGILQTTGTQNAINSLINKLSSFIPSQAAKSVFQTITKSAIGFGAEFPKIWQGAETNYSFEFDIRHYVYQRLNARDIEDEIKKVVGGISLFIFPRSTNNAGYNPFGSGSGSKSGSTKSDQLYVADLIFRYPYFCNLYDGRTGKKLIAGGMVTRGKIEFNHDETFTDGRPAILNISLTIEPILPLILNSDDSNYSQRKKGLMRTKDLAEILSSPEPRSTRLNDPWSCPASGNSVRSRSGNMSIPPSPISLPKGATAPLNNIPPIPNLSLNMPNPTNTFGQIGQQLAQDAAPNSSAAVQFA